MVISFWKNLAYQNSKREWYLSMVISEMLASDVRFGVVDLVDDLGKRWCGRRDLNPHGPFKPCGFSFRFVYQFLQFFLRVSSSMTQDV